MQGDLNGQGLLKVNVCKAKMPTIGNIYGPTKNVFAFFLSWRPIFIQRGEGQFIPSLSIAVSVYLSVSPAPK